ASEEEAVARLSEQRKQLEAGAAAQGARETTLKHRPKGPKQNSDAPRRRARGREISRLLVSILAFVRIVAAVTIWGNWRNMKRADEATNQLALLGAMIVDFAGQLNVKSQTQVFLVLEYGAINGNVTYMVNLAQFYEKGYGVPQDYAKAH